jgi:ABC-type glutathione transport system ATPase component
MNANAAPALEFQSVHKDFPSGKGRFGLRRGETHKAVDDVSISVRAGEAVGLVGESGSGKTTVARLMLDLLKPTSGTVEFLGRALGDMSRSEYRTYRRGVQAVFQDPATALNPRWPIVDIVAEPMRVAGELPNHEIRDRAIMLLDQVGLSQDLATRLPHELSGGMKQRVAIAAALALEPKLIVLDEPVSALDMSVRSQIINLLAKVRREGDSAYFVISHDLATIGHMTDRILTMYGGRIVEDCSAESFLATPRHPYSILLQHAARRGPELHRLMHRNEPPAAPPAATARSERCNFAEKCWLRTVLPDTSLCDSVRPTLTVLPGADGHRAACHYVEEAREAETVLLAGPLKGDRPSGTGRSDGPQEMAS